MAATRANASVNGVDEFIEASLTPVGELKKTWPLVLANLQLAVFERCAPDIGRLVEPGGRICLSGLLAEQVDSCIELWPDFEPMETLNLDELASVSMERKR